VSWGGTIIRATQPEQVFAAANLFDDEPDAQATADFLAASGHHLYLALEPDGRPIGFVSAVEMTHPDKGTEMFLYELGVEPSRRRQGVGAALVRHVRSVAEKSGCRGLWVLTEPDNDAAHRTYRSAGLTEQSAAVMLEWKPPANP
jgi:aminoglycoside 3-N-acetyltransferase I